MSEKKRMAVNFFLTLALFYVCAVTFLYFKQRELIYFPDKTRPVPEAWGVQEYIEVNAETSDGLQLQSWYFPPVKDAGPVVLLFHGNASHFAARVHKAPVFLEQGLGLLLAEYRGYGGNPGSPTEEGLYGDARAYIDWLEREQGIKPGQIILYGESLGSGPAVQMATEYSVKAVILESPYTALPDVAKQTYFFVPVDLLMKDQYRNIDKIGDIHVPLLIIHGGRDHVVPTKLGRRLYEAANEPKSFIELSKSGHNDVFGRGAQLHVAEFLRNISGQ